MSDLAKMNLIAIIQQLPKDDIDFVQTYIAILENRIARLEKENQELKDKIELEDHHGLIEENIELTLSNSELERELREANESIIWWSNRYNSLSRKVFEKSEK